MKGVTSGVLSVDDRPRVLYIHGIESGPYGLKVRLLRKVVGKSDVIAPDLKGREIIFFSTAACVIAVVLLLIGVISSWILATYLFALIVTFISGMVVLGLYVTVTWGVAMLVLQISVRRATQAFLEFKPNIICASSFGAVVLFNMDIPKLPILLFAPAQEAHRRFFRTRNDFSLAPYPYTLIVHGSNDRVVPLDDSIRLLETAELGRCRLEVIDGDHNLKNIEVEEMRTWVTEVFERGCNQQASTSYPPMKTNSMQQRSASQPPALTEPLSPRSRYRSPGSPVSPRGVTPSEVYGGTTGHAVARQQTDPSLAKHSMPPLQMPQEITQRDDALQHQSGQVNEQVPDVEQPLLR